MLKDLFCFTYFFTVATVTVRDGFLSESILLDEDTTSRDDFDLAKI